MARIFCLSIILSFCHSLYFCLCHFVVLSFWFFVFLSFWNILIYLSSREVVFNAKCGWDWDGMDGRMVLGLLRATFGANYDIGRVQRLFRFSIIQNKQELEQEEEPPFPHWKNVAFKKSPLTPWDLMSVSCMLPISPSHLSNWIWCGKNGAWDHI